MQTHSHLFKSAWHCLSVSLKDEGVRGLFRGVGSPILAQGLMNALLFAGESSAMRLFEPNLKPGEAGSPLNVFISGSVGGFCSCLALVPADVIKCRMQVDSLNSKNKFKGIFDCFSKIYSSEGFMGLYKGFTITVMREVPSLGIYFLVYKYSREYMRPSGVSEPSTLATLFAGGLAGSASWGLIYPIDVIKSNIQISNGKPLSMIETSLKLLRKYGPTVFFRGFVTTVVRAFPVNAATFYVYELMKKYVII
eukprot:gene17283-22819_t